MTGGTGTDEVMVSTGGAAVVLATDGVGVGGVDITDDDLMAVTCLLTQWTPVSTTVKPASLIAPFRSILV